jgi:hypothetical protein
VRINNDGYREGDINFVDRENVRREVGMTELRRIAQLHRWLSQGPPSGGNQLYPPDFNLLNETEVSFRSAPSIIVRSEAELFGINMPRFAYRALLADKDKVLGFANIRRIESFVKAVGRRLEVSRNQSFLNILRSNCRCIGDSFLRVPHWLHGYHIITTRLERWYGEQEIGDGTVFVTHFPVGGGMCAQAACFMATALLHEKAEGVFGVSEVTMYASPESNEQRFLKFSGLTPDDLARYFRHPSVGLNATVQNASTVSHLQQLLRGYVNSNCPVVLPVDMRCFKDRARNLGETPLYSRMGIEEQEAAEHQQLHAVLVVGANRSVVETEDNEFVIHDPATLPYAKVSAKELFNAASIFPGESAKLIPVTSREVKLTLSDTVVSHFKDLQYLPPEMPLKSMRRQTLSQGRMNHRIPGLSELLSGSQTSGLEWRLVALTDGGSTRRPHFIAKQSWSSLIEKLRGLSKVNGKHVWLACSQNEHVTVVRLFPSRNDNWSGIELTTSSGTVLPKFSFSFEKGAEAWTCSLTDDEVKEWMESAWVEWHPTEVQIAIAESCLASECPLRKQDPEKQESVLQAVNCGNANLLQLSLISSFTTKSRDVAEEHWSNLSHNPRREQYLWFQEDIQNSLKLYIGDTRLLDLTAVDAMAMIKPGGLLSQFLVNKHVDGGWRDTVTLATFIPEISAPPRSARGLIAQQAIRFLGNLAVDMQIEMDGMARRTAKTESEQDMKPGLRIELVAGSLVDTVFHNLSGDDQLPELVGSLIPRHEAHRNIAENLHIALTEAGNETQETGEVKPTDLCQLMSSRRICFALEQEPGPIFSLGSRESLIEFCSLLERHQVNQDGRNRYLRWKSLVGLNLDVAHWAMSGIEMAGLPLSVQMRIAHAHLSGHHPRAHFGDTWLDENDKSRFGAFVAWLKKAVLQASSREASNYPVYDGCISIEFEAARCVADVNRSLDIAKQLI